MRSSVRAPRGPEMLCKRRAGDQRGSAMGEADVRPNRAAPSSPPFSHAGSGPKFPRLALLVLKALNKHKLFKVLYQTCKTAKVVKVFVFA